MSLPQANTRNIDVHIHADGSFRFDPPPSPTKGYQFERHAERGTIVFRLVTKGYFFTGCSFVPCKGKGMPGVESRWGHPQPDANALIVTFDYPDGALHDGMLKIDYRPEGSQDSRVIDPQVGNDGQTGG